MENLQRTGTLLNFPHPVWSRDEIAGLAPVWRAEGILIPSKKVYILPCFCGEAHDAEIEHAADDLTGQVRQRLRCPESKECRELQPHADDGYEFNGEAMAELLHRILPCRGGVSVIVPGLLWHTGTCDVPFGGRRRDIFFALGVNTPERAGAVYAAFPRTTTPLLFAGASRIRIQDGFPMADRVFRLQDILSVKDDAWHVDYGVICERFPGTPPEKKTHHAAARGGETLARVMEELARWIRAEYDRYTSNRRSGREYRLHAPTMEALARAVGVNRSTVSDLFSTRLHGHDPRYLAVRELWETAHDIDKIVRRLRR